MRALPRIRSTVVKRKTNRTVVDHVSIDDHMKVSKPAHEHARFDFRKACEARTIVRSSLLSHSLDIGAAAWRRNRARRGLEHKAGAKRNRVRGCVAGGTRQRVVA
jgi:hypothetical protein